MSSSGMCRRVVLVGTDVSEELSFWEEGTTSLWVLVSNV
jgi:hypothetical protein